MNIIFFGFGNLGKKCMKELLDKGYNIKYVMTHKDNGYNSVDKFCEDLNIEYSYLDSRKNLEIVKDKININNSEYIVSVNYRYIIPKEVYSIVRYAINIHGSLLPKYRGRTPHVWSIIQGEEISGITAHLIEEDVDTGDIIVQKEVRIEKNDTGYSLLKKFENMYPNVLIEAIEKIRNKSVLIKQNENDASYYGKRTPDMGYIDFTKSANEIINFVRAQAEPYPGAYYYLLNGKKIIVNKVEIYYDELNIPLGVIKNIEDKYIIRCKDNLLEIKKYKLVN